MMTSTADNSNPVVFTFESFKVRAISKDGGVWFGAKDVTRILGYNNSSKATKEYCQATELFKGSEAVPFNIIPESDLQRLIDHSKRPPEEVKRFKVWLTSEVMWKMKAPVRRPISTLKPNAPMPPGITINLGGGLSFISGSRREA